MGTQRWGISVTSGRDIGGGRDKAWLSRDFPADSLKEELRRGSKCPPPALPGINALIFYLPIQIYFHWK